MSTSIGNLERRDLCKVEHHQPVLTRQHHPAIARTGLEHLIGQVVLVNRVGHVDDYTVDDDLHAGIVSAGGAR